MRTKLFAALIATCALAALGVGPASAAAYETTLMAKEAWVKPGTMVDGVSTHFTFYGYGGEFSCAEVSFSGKLMENDPVPRVEPNSLTFTGCSATVPGVGTFVMEFNNAEILDEIEFLPNGETASFGLKLTQNAPALGINNCPLEGDAAMFWTPSEAGSEPLEFLGSLTSYKGGCMPELEAQGFDFILHKQGGTPISIVSNG